MREKDAAYEFVRTVVDTKYENIPSEIAEYIGEQTWYQLDKDVRTARGIARRLRETTEADVDRVASFLKKYRRPGEGGN